MTMSEKRSECLAFMRGTDTATVTTDGEKYTTTERRTVGEEMEVETRNFPTMGAACAYLVACGYDTKQNVTTKKSEKEMEMNESVVKVEQPMMKPKGLEMDVNKEQFALALKTWRLRMGLTQGQVGKRWGCSRWTILRAEKCKNLTWEMAYRMFARLSWELRNETTNTL